jgi:hypothetical protein
MHGAANFERNLQQRSEDMTSKNASNITAATQFLEVGNEKYAYRRFGTGSRPPLLCLQHFTGTLDNWNPSVGPIFFEFIPTAALAEHAVDFYARQSAISSLVGKRAVAFFENASQPSIRISNTPPPDRRRLICAEGRSLRIRSCASRARGS